MAVGVFLTEGWRIVGSREDSLQELLLILDIDWANLNWIKIVKVSILVGFIAKAEIVHFFNNVEFSFYTVIGWTFTRFHFIR